MIERPNVLFIVCDDLNDAVSGMGGHPQARTPNIERLMRRGVRFTNAQTNVPICGPSRASFLSGIAPWTSGHCGYTMSRTPWWENAILRDCRTFMEHFGDHGYGVYGTGKIFHNGEEKNEVWRDGHGYDVDWGPWTWDGLKGGRGWQACCHHPNCPASWGPEMLFAPLSDVPDLPPNPATGVPGYRGWRYGDNRPFRYVSEDDRDPMPDEMNARWAADVLQKPFDRPRLLCVGIGKPHTPLVAPKKYFDLFPLETIQLAETLEDDLADCAKIIRDGGLSDKGWGLKKYQQVLDVGGEHMLKRWTQAYLACVAFADAQIGTILDALESSPAADNTLVILTSDNGYHMGEKQWLFKYSPWEEANRVPLVIAGAGLARGVECDRPVSLLDLYPTMVDCCSLPRDPNRNTSGRPLEGCSLRPLLEQPDRADWAGAMAAISMVSGPAAQDREHAYRVADEHFSVRSRTHRYILYTDGEEELYDHRTDGHEWHNLAGRSEQADVQRSLRAFLAATTGR